MKLLTEEIRKKLPPLYSQENVKDPIVHVKFFTPWTNWTWYATEFDGKDLFFGWVVGLEKELGYFTLSELESVRGPGGIGIERDMYFVPKPLSQVFAEHGEKWLMPQVRPSPTRGIRCNLIHSSITPSKKGALYPHMPKSRAPLFPHTTRGQVMPQTFGGERIPSQYRNLVDYIDEPLPDAALMTWPAVEVEEGERKIDAVMRSLKNGVETIQSSTNFRQFLTTMSKFHSYSIGNQILIMIQKPEATRVAGYNTWKDLGRWVKKGESGISILAPRFPPRPNCPKCGAKVPRNARYCPVCGAAIQQEEMEMEPRYFLVVSVFDVSQTEGKPLPEFDIPVLTGEVNEELFNNVMALASKQGVTVSFESRPNQDPAIKGQFLAPHNIWVRPEEARAQQLKTLLHEMSHYYSEGVFRIPRRDAETIAESAAFVVGAHYGFDTGVRSFPYVALWAQEEKVLKENLSNIRRVATTILEGLEKA